MRLCLFLLVKKITEKLHHILRRLLLIIFDSVIAYRDISGTTKPIDVNSTLCAATLTLRIIKRVSKKGVMITATNNQF